MNVDEYEFESEIADWLIRQGGYEPGQAANFDPALGIDTSELAIFIGHTQGDEWEKLVMLHGGVTETAQRAFYARLAAELQNWTSAALWTCSGTGSSTKAWTSDWPTSSQPMD